MPAAPPPKRLVSKKKSSVSKYVPSIPYKNPTFQLVTLCIVALCAYFGFIYYTGYKVTVLTPGDGTNYPSRKSIVTIHTEIYAADAERTLLDSTKTRKTPVQMEIDSGNALMCLNEALKHMSLGETAEVFCKHQYAYGSKGYPPIVSPYQNIIIFVELLHIQPPTS